MRPEELDELARRHGFRRGLNLSDRWVVAVAVVSIGWPVMGVAFALTGNDVYQRLVGVGAAAIGCTIAWFAWRFVARPVRPARDDNFERELKHRGFI